MCGFWRLQSGFPERVQKQHETQADWRSTLCSRFGFTSALLGSPERLNEALQEKSKHTLGDSLHSSCSTLWKQWEMKQKAQIHVPVSKNRQQCAMRGQRLWRWRIQRWREATVKNPPGNRCLQLLLHCRSNKTLKRLLWSLSHTLPHWTKAEAATVSSRLQKGVFKTACRQWACLPHTHGCGEVSTVH